MSSVPAVALLMAEEVWGTTLHAMRSLDRAGADPRVVVAGRGAGVYRRSRGCHGALDLDCEKHTDFCDEAVRWMIEQVSDRPVVVLPLSDRLVEVLHSNRARFPANFVLGIPDAGIADALLDKSGSLRIAEDAGLKVPQWVEITTSEEVDRIDMLSGAVAIRPTKWSTGGPDYFKISVHADAPTAAEWARAAVARGAELIAQSYVDAPEDHVEFAIVWRSSDGEVTALCTGRKRRQSDPSGGVMVWGSAVHLPDVADGAAAFLDASGFTGLGGIEFIRTAGHLAFIEFNPRLEAIHFLAGAAGVDTVALAYQDLGSAHRPPAPPVQHPASAWVGSAWLNRVLTDRTYRSEAVLDRVRFARSPRRVRAVCTWSDPLPGVAVATRVSWRALRSAVRRMRPQ